MRCHVQARVRVWPFTYEQIDSHGNREVDGLGGGDGDGGGSDGSDGDSPGSGTGGDGEGGDGGDGDGGDGGPGGTIRSVLLPQSCRVTRSGRDSAHLYPSIPGASLTSARLARMSPSRSCKCAKVRHTHLPLARGLLEAEFGPTGAQAGEADTAAGERETKRRKTAMPTCDKSWSLTWIWFAEK